MKYKLLKEAAKQALLEMDELEDGGNADLEFDDKEEDRKIIDELIDLFEAFGDEFDEDMWRAFALNSVNGARIRRRFASQANDRGYTDEYDVRLFLFYARKLAQLGIKDNVLGHSGWGRDPNGYQIDLRQWCQEMRRDNHDHQFDNWC